jgi:hypothetical protein
MPRPGFQWDLAGLPTASAELDSGFEQRELIRPRGETALAPKGIEFGEDGQQRVIGALLGEVVIVTSADVRRAVPPAVHLKAGRAKQQLAQVTQGDLALATVSSQSLYPRQRFAVEAGPQG